jgi:DNA-binding IclR family transcriptional regulator
MPRTASTRRAKARTADAPTETDTKSTAEAPAEPDTKSTSAVGRALDILRILRRAPAPLALTAIAKEVGIAASSAHSILTQLLREDAVVLDADKRYSLGPSIFYIGSAYARGSGIYRAIWSELINAANDLAVTAALAVPWENHHLIIARHRALNGGISVAFGGRVPLDGGSWGKVYYAWSGDKVPATLTRYTDATITDRKAYLSELEQVRRTGYAVDAGEFEEDVTGVSAPVTSSVGYEGLAAFLAPSARAQELTVEALGARVSALAARASLALGARDRVRLYGEE